MNLNELELPDVRALVAFGRAGMEMMGARILSILALTGVVALSAYSIYASSWQGAACVGIVALFVFVPALKAESNRRNEDAPPQA